ncbi:MAG TPA: helix-turn-helix domain-containing protein [Gaiellaceae bacterium]|nr:helix-turn-helix domain-containing protein [Gaiellaceae bacterium]
MTSALDNQSPAAHKALAEPSRVRVLEALEVAPEPLDAAQLARAVDLHPNTVRWHLGVLADAGLVASEVEERHRRGRPRVVYRATGSAPGEREDYRLLAAVLAGSLSTSPDGPAAAEAAGRAWGRYLVERPLPLTAVDEDAAAGEVVRLLDEHGFRPERENETILMHRCPFRDLAEQHGDVVCSAHLGLIRGALEEIGAPITATRLEPFVEPRLCRAHLGPRVSATS